MWWSAWWLVAVVWATPPVRLGGKPGRAQHLKRLEIGADAESALRLAQGLGREQHLRHALDWLKRAQARGAHPLRVALVRADVLRDCARPAEAASAFLEVIEAAPRNAYAHLELWRLLRDARLPPGVDRARLRGALVAAGYFLGEAPLRPRDRAAAEALEAAARSALKAGDFAGARAGFEAAIAADDDLAAAFEGLGEAQRRLGDPARAAAAWRIFLALSPRDTRRRRLIAQVVDDVERQQALAPRR